MKTSKHSQQNCAIKTQNKIEVFYSETSRVFYVKTKKEHKLPEHFKSLITCAESLFNGFLNHLEEFVNSKQPKLYTFKELENKLNVFLIKRAKNCKVYGTIEINKAS